MSHSLTTRQKNQAAVTIPDVQPDSAALSPTDAKDLRKLESVIERARHRGGARR